MRRRLRSKLYLCLILGGKDDGVLALRELCESDRKLYLLAASSEPGCENLHTDDVSANIMWSLAYGGKGKRETYVIENADVFVGYCSIEPGNTPEIDICLLPDYQGKGIGVNAIRLLWEKISMERELHYFVARVEECNVNSVKMFEKLGAKKMQTEESDVLKNLRELASVDKSLISVLVGMENFHNRIIQYAVAFDES